MSQARTAAAEADALRDEVQWMSDGWMDLSTQSIDFFEFV